MTRHRSRPRRSLLAAVAVVVVAVGLALFQPWKLVVDDVVQEALPAGLSELGPEPSGPVADPGRAIPPAASVAPAGPTATTPATTPVTTPVTTSPAATSPATTSPATPVARVVARGSFVSHEHATTGTVRIIALADGGRLLRIDDLDTSNGPDLRVWITDAAVRPGQDGWRVFDDGVHVELGRLKGNRGSQNYAVPDSVDLRRLGSLTIWCDRFNVSFGAAALQLTG